MSQKFDPYKNLASKLITGNDNPVNYFLDQYVNFKNQRSNPAIKKKTKDCLLELQETINNQEKKYFIGILINSVDSWQ